MAKIKKIGKLALAAAAIVFLSGLLVLPVFAQTANFLYTCEEYEYPWCEATSESLAGLVEEFYILALGVAGASAFAMFIYGAILYTTSGVVGKKQEAMDIIKGAIYGVALLLAAYLLLRTINPDLVNLGAIQQQLSEAPEVTSVPTGFNLENLFSSSIGAENAPYLQPVYNEAVARDRLFNGGFGNTLRSSCPPGGSTQGCVNFEGIKKETVDEMISLREQLGSPYTITSATEGSHAIGDFSHGNGYKFDAEANNAGLNNLIRTTFTPSGERRDSVTGRLEPIYRNPQTGAEYVFEPTAQYVDREGVTRTRPAHWDVLVKPPATRS